MRNLILTTILLIGFLGYAQKPKVEALRYKEVTTTERDAFTVPSGEHWKIYNTTTSQFEYWDGDSWEVVSGAGGSNIYTADGVTPTSSSRYVDLGEFASLFFRSYDYSNYIWLNSNNLELRNTYGGLRFRTGTGGTVAGNSVGDVWTATSTVGDGHWATPSGSGHVIQDAGAPVTVRPNLNFNGSGVTVSDNAGNSSTDITINGATVSDVAYSASWNADTEGASKNALFDKIESVIAGVGTGAEPQSTTAEGTETEWVVTGAITSSHKLFVNGIKLVEGASNDYTQTGSTFTFTGYSPVAGHEWEYYPDIAVPASGGGDMLASNNLSDVANVATARTNLGVDVAGTDNSDNNAVNTLYSGLISFDSTSSTRLANTSGTNTGDQVIPDNTDYVDLTSNQSIGGQKTVTNSDGTDLFTFSNTYNSILSSALSASNSTALGIGFLTSNTGSGKGIYAINTDNTGDNIIADALGTATGFNFVGKNAGANTFTVNKTGDVTANSFTGDGSGLTGISGLDTAANYTVTGDWTFDGGSITLGGSSVSMDGAIIEDLGTPVQPTDAATKAYVDLDKGTTYNQATEPTLTSTVLPNTASFVANVNMRLYVTTISATDYHFWVQLSE